MRVWGVRVWGFGHQVSDLGAIRASGFDFGLGGACLESQDS